MVEVKGLTKVFKNIRAVDNLSFKVKEGEIYGLLGENGAGKTTTLRMLATMLKPTSGTAVINGRDLIKEPEEIRKEVGTISIFKELLYGIINMTHIGIFVFSSIVYVIISIYMAALMFKQEWALFRV
ncbi:ATP-binding cassette domain-containing protein [Caldanaerobacter subterraneus KAk]|uniref:ATP-binding cassette domain-containing protein n=1 Tax=Caldanaerobacter subterraneus TaxID=911092 RepID=UPI0032C0A6B5